jgi:four helix bundle protein
LSLDVLEASFELIRALRTPLHVIQSRDRELARQIRSASSSIALNLAEGRERTGGDRLHGFRVAHGSAREVRAALRIAREWEYLRPEVFAELDRTLDRIRAMCWRLTRR